MSSSHESPLESGRPQERPLVSVVLPVRNEERFIAATLAQLQAQRYPAELIEFLVCDGRSDDRTREVVGELTKADPRIRLLDNPGQRSSSGRNVGFRNARGEILLVVDGHVKIDSLDLIENIVQCFELSGADCLGRPQRLIPVAGKPWSEVISLARAFPLGHDSKSLIYSAYEGFSTAASIGAAYRPSVFKKIGYVDEDFDACEDVEFNTRIDKAGLRCFTSPKLEVLYYARTSPGALFRQLYRYGFGRFKYLRRHPDRLSLGQLAPALLVAGVLSLPLLYLIPLESLRFTILALTGAYVLTVVLSSLWLSLKTRWRYFPRFLVVFCIIHVSVGLGFLASLFRGGRLKQV